ncbi:MULTISPECIES: ABC transporter permease [unclassified Devosia]|uniref:ABC transporter permease n=1 Tax=unclassified Devosia TaxID=196773 RepID=UPI00145FB1B1|nr:MULTISPECIES: ABC transporter permease [unclassified Devosia]MBJ6986439.1 ABC transporter permease [Devosia sp. MC521]MBJ7576552.1 ABC transporter permease [Devosia sp. MC532]MBK1795847.1 ABC transporter permease [Devosia sp. WQ 349K1]QMW64091.1 ABC transporter permease [Devosia sp. MC521]
MLGYAIKRLLSAIPVLFGILLVTFSLSRLIPGDPCKAMLGDKVSEATCIEFERSFGLDQPIWVQFFYYIRDVAQGDFGNSIRFSRPVTQIIIERLPMTMELALSALVIATICGIAIGIFAARRHNTAADVGTMAIANVGIAMPVFWLGLMMAYVFGVMLKGTPFWLPPSGRLTAGLVSVPFYEAWGWEITKGTFFGQIAEFISNFFIFNALITFNWTVFNDAVRHMILPAMAVATIPMAVIARMTRSSLLDVLGRDYVRTARAKGVPDNKVVQRHALGNAMLPVVTILGLQMGALLSGAVLTETVFGLAGVGRMLMEAIFARDYPIVQGFTVLIATIYVVVNLIVDLSYTYLDPRVRPQ